MYQPFYLCSVVFGYFFYAVKSCTRNCIPMTLILIVKSPTDFDLVNLIKNIHSIVRYGTVDSLFSYK